MQLPDETMRALALCNELFQHKIALHKQLRSATDHQDYNKIVELIVENTVEDVRYMEIFAKNQGIADRPSEGNMEEVRKRLFHACNAFALE